MKKLISGLALCMSMTAVGCVAESDQPRDDDTDDTASAIVGRHRGGALRNSGVVASKAAFVSARMFIIEVATRATFHLLWGHSGTIFDDGQFRLDIQNPVNGMQNIQVQRGSSTIAGVLISHDLARLDAGDANDPHALPYYEMGEMMNRVREGLIRSLYTVWKNSPSMWIIDGSYSNGSPGRRRLTEVASFDVPVGPLWGQADANSVCPAAARAAGGEWTRNWATTEANVMSVCNVNPVFHVRPGPIWNNHDAGVKCPPACGAEGLQWTGGWWTVVPNRMSECECH